MTASHLTISAFPAAWDAIAEPGPPFTHDMMHFPFPISPLMGSAFAAFCEGHRDGFRDLGIPEEAFQLRIVNHYRYDRQLMETPSSESEAAALGARVEQSLQRELERMIDRWFGEHRPRLVALDQRLRTMQPQIQDASAVLAMLDEADAMHREAWKIHFTIAPLMTLAMQIATEMHDDLFSDDPGGAMVILAGSVTESMNAGFGLGDLAERARELGLAAVMRDTPPDGLMAALETSVAGWEFLADLRAYLDDYGLRLDLFDVATPTWREDPTVALASISGYLASGHDPRAAHAATAREAEAAFAAAMERLAHYPAAISEQFEHVVQLGRQGAFLQEEHNFYIDQRILALLRLFCLEVGAYLRDRDLLDRNDDVFMLELDEVRELVAAAGTPLLAGNTRALVARRRDELAQAATMTPPPMIGDPTGSRPIPDTVLSRSLAGFFGSAPPAAPEPDRIAGTPGSRGIASGIAHVARTLDEARRMQPGEILVTITTMPPWTPLFGIAAAVVTETGGPLSHCAVVAREYGIPAVVGAHGATAAIRSGQRVTVDGDAGVVTIAS